jgi:hypothetical protein
MRGGPGMMDRQQLLANMQVSPCDPAAVLAVQDKLNLTPMQVKNLEKALARIRKQTEQILTPEQRQQLETLLGPADATPPKHPLAKRKGLAGQGRGMRGKAPADVPPPADAAPPFNAQPLNVPPPPGAPPGADVPLPPDVPLPAGAK